MRSPEGAWNKTDFADTDWAKAIALPADITPVDEGPGLPPIARQDFANVAVELGGQLIAAVSTVAHPRAFRAALAAADPLQAALDRPNREVVMPGRASTATTMQALELTNGSTLDQRLNAAAAQFTHDATRDPSAWLTTFYRQALGRAPTEAERNLALELLGAEPKTESISDLLWAVFNLPEFQLIN